MEFMQKLCALFLVVAAPVSAVGAQTKTDAPYLEKDKAELIGMLTGTWSTDRQSFFAEEAGYSLSRIAPLQTVSFAAVSAPDDALASVRETAGETVLRGWHEFKVEGGALVHQIGRDEGSSGPCRVDWQRVAGGFAGRAESEDCAWAFPGPDTGEPLRVSLSVSRAELTVAAARGADVEDAVFRKARPFVCWVGVLKGSSHGDSGEGANDWDFRQGVALHDQGGDALIETAEQPPRKVRLRLRDVDWPYGDRRPSLTLYVYEGDSDRAVSYAWTEGGSDRIGINLRWVQASCTRSGAD